MPLKPEQVKTIAQAKKIVEERGLTHIKVGVFDGDAILRGKYMSKAKFFSALEGGFGFCDVVLGWDNQDQLIDGLNYTGWHTAYPDAWARIIPETCRDLPMEDNGLLFLSEFVNKAEEICARGTLRRVLAKAAKMGFDVYSALEFEFFMFDETPESVREKNYKNLTPMTPGWFGYSVIRNSVWSELYQDILDMCEKMRMPIEGLHTETGPGVLEAALGVTSALEAADRGALFKTFMKVLAQRRGLMATFMAKWNAALPGQSGHVHVSLFNKSDGSSAFFEEGARFSMSNVMRSFVAGQVKYLPEVLAMVCPTVNDYRRLVPGMWAPTSSSWGVENRTTALRVIPGSEKSQRSEYRIGPADANPYLALAAALGTGLRGIEEKLELGEPVQGSAYQVSAADAPRLPSSLEEAAERLSNSSAAREVYGDAFIDHFVATRQWEVREYRKHVSDWELARYFEII